MSKAYYYAGADDSGEFIQHRKQSTKGSRSDGFYVPDNWDFYDVPETTITGHQTSHKDNYYFYDPSIGKPTTHHTPGVTDYGSPTTAQYHISQRGKKQGRERTITPKRGKEYTINLNNLSSSVRPTSEITNKSKSQRIKDPTVKINRTKRGAMLAQNQQPDRDAPGRKRIKREEPSEENRKGKRRNAVNPNAKKRIKREEPSEENRKGERRNAINDNNKKHKYKYKTTTKSGKVRYVYEDPKKGSGAKISTDSKNNGNILDDARKGLEETIKKTKRRIGSLFGK